jgi:hypothetical protein
MTAHALDVAGRLPFVHEAAPVRTAMTPTQIVVWLALAAALSAAAAGTRPVLLGAPSALLVSAAPEIAGRGDPGAVLEPGALLGALLQLLLVVAVVALAVVLERRIGLVVLGTTRLPSPLRAPVSRAILVRQVVDRMAEPRAPPAVVVTTT